jgi:hypothetical protein
MQSMSALGHKQTFCHAGAMSAFPPIATLIACFGMSALGHKRTSCKSPSKIKTPGFACRGAAGSSTFCFTKSFCGRGPQGELKVLRFSIGDGNFVFGVPNSLERQFGSAKSFGFFEFPFVEFEKVKSHLPSPLSKYVDFDENYIILHTKAIDAFHFELCAILTWKTLSG